MIAPLFAELSEQMPDVVFLKIDVDANPDTAAKYNVSAMPTFGKYSTKPQRNDGFLPFF